MAVIPSHSPLLLKLSFKVFDEKEQMSSVQKLQINCNMLKKHNFRCL